MKNFCPWLAAVLVMIGSLHAAADTPQLWQVAKPAVVVPGAPKHSDVSMRSLRPHPVRPGDPYDTLEMAREFHLTRLEWTYEMDAAFISKAKALGLTVGGALEDESSDVHGSKKFGRVTGQDGQLKKHCWFPEGRWVGCANAPEFMEATLLWAKRDIDAGVDIMQQDDPSMAIRCVPPFCYCNYCKAAFVQYQKAHGTNASYEQFQKDSILAYHQELHRRVDAYAGRHVPFSENNGIGRDGQLNWTSSAFEFALAEIDPTNVYPASLYKKFPGAHGKPLSFQFRETSVENNRRGLAAFYALGATMLMPWDVFMLNAGRYFGTAAEYADLSGFIRANAKYLDDYEDAAAAGPGLKETRYGAEPPLKIEGGSGGLFAFARALNGHSNAPVAIHLVEWSAQPKTAALRLRTPDFFGGGALKISLRTPTPYDAESHRQAQARGDFTKLAVETPLKTTIEGEFTTIQIPPLSPWGILVVRP